MNWFKDNPFLAGIVAVCLVGSGVLGYLIFDSAAAFSASSEAYTAAVAKLHTLQNKVPFPSEANLKGIKSALADYSARIGDLRAQLAKMEVPLDEKVTPQQFQDGLRTAVNDIRIKAEANGVKLPANFYFGFDQYQTQVPNEQAAPFLHRQFLVIQSLVVRLVDFKVASIDGVARTPLPQESAAPGGGAKKPDAAEPVLSRFPFDISFTAEQGKFRVAFNSLLGSDQFLIVRSLTIQNSSPQAPAKKSSDPAAASSNPLAAVAGTPGKDQSNLQVILGRELLKVTLRLEMLDFSEPVAAKK
ncbi:MAG: Amuc_1100 family pilus-like protein [Verrucomicrobia bacterium]|nr:Amuc_1100 family pilus-like protein [Verrucomicrobiota bacterium]